MLANGFLNKLFCCLFNEFSNQKAGHSESIWFFKLCIQSLDFRASKRLESKGWEFDLNGDLVRKTAGSEALLASEFQF